ncbi:MAG: HAMP domain-containing histidine kinase [Muribaculaceae bacterium]|nr:HAMP domain-containing histidine kinase [Muribaculaceae bacterium]MDE5968309.1 HAMP domain-containing histidine kinase [Muribaculaceae bacterium]
MKHLLSGLLLLISALTANAVSHPKLILPDGAERDTLVAHLYQDLSAATTNDDSITILYHIFDLVPRDARYDVAMTLYETAKSVKNYDIMLDALRNASNSAMRNDSILRILTNKARRIPDSNNQRETLAFLNIVQAQCKSNTATPEQRAEAIKDLVGYYRNHGTGDIYQRIQLLGEIAIYLNRSTGSYAVYDYLESALNMTDSITSKSNALRNTILTNLATSSLRSFDSEKVLGSNQRYIELLDSMEENYHREGRIYKQYHNSRANAMTRMLTQYAKMDIRQVDSIYNEILLLEEIDPDARRLSENNPSAKAFYLMAHQRYGEAIPLLQKIVNRNASVPTPFLDLLYLHNLIKAARATNNKELQLEALARYVDISNDVMTEMRQDRYRQLESLYDVSHLRDQNQQMQNRYDNERKNLHRTQTRLFIILSILLLSLAILLWILLVRRRQLSNRLKESNERLHIETEQLLESQAELVKARDEARSANTHKTEFITNLSHEVMTPLDAVAEYSQLIVDCVDENRRQYLQRFADIIRLNTDLVKTIVSDVLEMGSLEDKKMRPKLRPASLKSIIETAVGAVQPMIQPGVKLIQPSLDEDDAIIITDRHRVEQVLINLLSNAAKFTPEGSITFDYHIDDDNETVTFTVTDTGIGVPDGKEKIIFERFEKIDSSSQGSGLGLSICAAAAKLLKGNIYCEEGMESGSRFVFTVPML